MATDRNPDPTPRSNPNEPKPASAKGAYVFLAVLGGLFVLLLLMDQLG